MTAHDAGPATRPDATGRTIWNRGLLLSLLAMVLWFSFSTTATILEWDSEAAVSVSDRAVEIAVMLTLYFAMFWRAGMVRVRVDQDGLVVRNVWRTRRLAWEDIQGFEPQLRWRLHRTAAVLHDGRRVPLAVVTLYLDASSGWGVRQTGWLDAERTAALDGRSIDEAAEMIAASAPEPTPTAPMWARIVLPLVVVLVGLVLVAPGLLIAGPALVVLVGGALGLWRALGGGLDRRAAPLLTAAGAVVVLRVLVELGQRAA